MERRTRVKLWILLGTVAPLAMAVLALVAVLSVSPQRSARWYIFRVYVLPRYVGFWARPERPDDYTGVWRVWHESGGIYQEEAFVDGTRHGRHTKYAGSDVITEEGNYERGDRAGKWTWRNFDGDIIAQGTYIDGKEWEGTFELPHPHDGHCDMVVTYREGVRHGPYSVWNLSKLEEGSYADGHLEGIQTQWWSAKRGFKAREGRLVAGKRDGVWTWWGQDLAWDGADRPIAQGEYRDGEPWHGAFVEWDTEKYGWHPHHGHGKYSMTYYLDGREVSKKEFKAASEQR